jgi:uncharacterized membrane protein YbaN (DUF454 family)
LLKTQKKKWIVLVVGWAFILVGIAGPVLPILPGVLFLVIGLVVLSTEYLWAHQVLTKLTSRFPSVATHLHQATEKARRWTGQSAPESE